jgi:chromosome segregation ATPase
MTSAGTSHTTRPTGPDGDALLRDAGVNIARDELANFAALADPEAIAGTAVASDSSSRNRIERENSDLVSRLRAELQRRAKQVENLSRDLSSSQTTKSDTEERLRELSDEVAQARTSIVDRE